MVSGGAPLNPKIGIFFSALGVPILQGYGQTETAPLISANLPSNPRMDTVGPPVEGTEVKIAEDGEILVRGDLIMKGYWNNKKETSKVIRDGWIHTGDIGTFVENGHLKITDRKKDIIVNSGGDNISPQKIEGLLTIQEEIMQAAVFGDKQSYLVALIVPDETWSKGQTKDIKLTIKAVVDRVNKSLSTIEKIKRFTIISSPFSIENEQMTPTMKVRRHIVRDKYEAQLNKMYP
jgi:long-chain acyl-CoA synthetase